MVAQAGDWALRDPDGDQWWSVKDNIFTTSYRHLDGSLWQRHGTVLARQARPGERVRTLEGELSAAPGDWVVQGEGGELWTVPADEFGTRYEGPIPADHRATQCISEG